MKYKEIDDLISDIEYIDSKIEEVRTLVEESVGIESKHCPICKQCRPMVIIRDTLLYIFLYRCMGCLKLFKKADVELEEVI